MKVFKGLTLLTLLFSPIFTHADVLNQPAQPYETKKESSVYLLKNPETEIIGNQKEFLGNGIRDTQFKLILKGYSGKTIDWIELTALDLQGFVWDTIPRNQHWLIAVIHNKVIMNHPNGSFNYTINSNDPLVLDLYIQDNGTITEGKTKYEVSVGFIDGEILTIPVKRT